MSDLEIISRSEWGATAGDGSKARALPATETWLHHTVTKHLPMTATKAEECAQMRVIEGIGVERFGVTYGFPYTFAVFPSGRIYAGHNIEKVGAHTKGHNTVGVAITLPGDYTLTAPTTPQLRSVARLLVHLHEQGKTASSRLTGGHRDVFDTACPGDRAYGLIDSIRTMVKVMESEAIPTPLDLAGTYMVQRGDTLDGIAKRFGTSSYSLRLLNGLPPGTATVAAGRRLYVRWHVRSGQTLVMIARSANTTVATLARINRIDNPDRISAGDLLILP